MDTFAHGRCREINITSFVISIIFTLMILCPVAFAGDSAAPAGRVDMLDFFLQTDDTANTWTLQGFDIKRAADPEGQDAVTYVGNKFSDTGAYEVFHASEKWIYNRYELARYYGAAGTGNWIRRFNEVGKHRSALGALWCPRYVTPGEPGFLSHHAIDRFVFDNDNRKYVFDRDGSTTNSVNFISVVTATPPPNLAPDVKIEPADMIRIVQEWHPLGLIVEMYDYAKGKGIVAWRWTERLEWIMRSKRDPSGNFYRSEYGALLVVSDGDEEHKPEVYEYDPETGQRGKRLEAFLIKSHWLPDSPASWYVVTHDTFAQPVDYKQENIPVDYTLPEWTSKPGASLIDLPYINTKPVPGIGSKEPAK